MKKLFVLIALVCAGCMPVHRIPANAKPKDALTQNAIKDCKAVCNAHGTSMRDITRDGNTFCFICECRAVDDEWPLQVPVCPE